MTGRTGFDLSARAVKINSEVVKLTATRYALLALFAKNEGKVLTHEYLLKEVWGADYVGQLQYLRVYVAQLRNKIEKDANHPAYILQNQKWVIVLFQGNRHFLL